MAIFAISVVNCQPSISYFIGLILLVSVSIITSTCNFEAHNCCFLYL